MQQVIIPQGLIVGVVLSSSLHVVYLLIRLGNLLQKYIWMDPEVLDLLRHLLYATGKNVVDVLVLAGTHFPIFPDSFPWRGVLLGASMFGALLEEVMHIRLPLPRSHEIQARRRPKSPPRTTPVAIIADWLSPAIRFAFTIGCPFSHWLWAYLWTTLGVTLEYFFGCICREVPPDHNVIAYHFRLTVASLACGVLSLVGIFLKNHRYLLLGVRTPSTGHFDAVADRWEDCVESGLRLGLPV
jgi:hypothetical protein